MTTRTAPARVSVLDPRMLVQFARYGLSGGAAVTTHLAVLMMLIELVGSPPVLASVLGFASATFVNYTLQHRFVFSRSRGHGSYFPRYLAVTLGTMTLNTLLFSILSNGLGIHYLASQVITIGVIVPINFMLNRSFTFRCAPRACDEAMNGVSVALFDLDGTITRRDTYLAYLVGFLARHPKRWPRAAPLPLALLCHLAGWRSNTWLKTTFLRAVLGGVPRQRLESWTESFVERVLSRGLRAGALETIERHRSAGHGLVLVTASLDFYAEPLGRRLGFDTILCTRAQYDAAGRVTGELDGGNCYGANKLVRVQQYVQQHLPGTSVICYCDHHSDLPLLRFAQRAIAVNPTRRLRRTAERMGLPIEDWT